MYGKREHGTGKQKIKNRVQSKRTLLSSSDRTGDSREVKLCVVQPIDFLERERERERERESEFTFGESKLTLSLHLEFTCEFAYICIIYSLHTS